MAEGIEGLSWRLNRLFETIPRPEGGLYTNEAAARALIEQGVKVTPQHLWLLRSGKRDNPSFRLLEGISRLFGVPLAYFSDAEVEHQVAQELATLVAVRDAGVRTLLTRTQGLSARNIEQLRVVVEQIRRAEGLDAQDLPAPAERPS